MFEGFTHTTFNVNGIDINPPLAEWQTVVNPVKFEWGGCGGDSPDAGMLSQAFRAG